jgi:hypothetical protein
MFASLLDSSVRAKVDFDSAPAALFNPGSVENITVEQLGSMSVGPPMAPSSSGMARSAGPRPNKKGTHEGHAIKAGMADKVSSYHAAFASKIKQEQKQEMSKRLQAHFKFVNQSLKTRCFVGWANFIRNAAVQQLQGVINKEQEKMREAQKSHAKHSKEMGAMLTKEKEGQEEGKVRYYQAAVRKTLLRCRFFQWVETLYQGRIIKIENLLQLEFDQRQQMEREKRELENELEDVYLGKARAEAERDECMGALRAHREKEETDMNRLLEEVGYLKAEVYAS